ncbi:putative capsid completion protein [Salmonella enterica subsp. enterica serovar Hartford]|nr:putative capsid completion protein [Salmonella enterica subsp. enterica serovar Hartford]
MKFVAPEQAPEQAEVIKNTPFWPDVDLSEFRSVMRTDGTVTQPRLKQVVLTAISEVNAELYDFRNRQQMQGWRTLAEVPAEMLDGKSERIRHYHNAVFCWARAVLNERYQDYDATASGVKRGEELAEAAAICGVMPLGHQPGAGYTALYGGAYLMKVRAHQYDTVDALCWRHYGRTQGVTEQVLQANPGLAEYGPFLPHGLQVELPDITASTTAQTVQLWD